MALGLAACQQDADFAGQSCTQMRAHFDDAFGKSVDAAVANSPAEKKRHVDESRKTYLAMEAQGCCQQGMCPPLNVH